MKKVILSLTLAAVSICGVVLAVKFLKPKTEASANSDYLRIHIRANSNSEEDQSVKYKVKEAIVELLTPVIATSTSQKAAKAAIAQNISAICAEADRVLEENGYSYSSHAEIRVEEFPTRSYGSTTLEAGSYEALIVELGSGTGDNWWCVMFPPLCFVGGESNGQNSIRYKSKIYEIISEYC